MPRITHQIRDIVTSNGVPIGKGEIAFPGIRNGIALRIKDAVNEFASLNEALSYKPRVNVALAHARANSWKHSSVGVIQYIGRTFKQETSPAVLIARTSSIAVVLSTMRILGRRDRNMPQSAALTKFCSNPTVSSARPISDMTFASRSTGSSL